MLALVAVGFTAGLVIAPPAPAAVAARNAAAFSDSGSLVLAPGSSAPP